VGRLMPDVMIQDAVVPRSRLPEVLADTYRISAKYNLQMANVFHAGDGNLHPLICFDLRRGADIENVRQAGREIMETCVRAGGSITGEHGVGLDKSVYLPLIFSEDDMDTMLRVRAAFDPSGLSNPGKIIPMPRGCGEARAVANVDVSEPRAVATGSSATLERKAQSIDSKSRFDPVATALGSDTQSSRSSLVAARMNENRIARDLSRRLGDVGVRRLTEFTIELRDNQRAERLIEVTPTSAEQASDVMKFAAAERLAVIPAGARRFIDAGNLLTQADLILSTRQMNRFITHEPADLVATVEAGMPLRAFQERLAEAGQWLPVDPPDEANTTIGSIVATAAAGPQSFGYGPLRSFVIGLRTVLADGRRIKAGGHVVKNVAGYDLCKLFTGSYGTLGVITEVTFKLRPLPAEARTIVAFGARGSLLLLARQIATNSSPAAVEMVSPILARDLGLSVTDNACALLVRFAGSSRAVVTQTAQTLKTLRDAGFRCITYDEDLTIWRTLSNVISQAKPDLSWRSRVRGSEVSALIDDVAALERDDAWRSTIRWHAGVGDGRMRFLARTPVYHQEAVRALERARQTAEDRGGSLVLQHAPVEIKREFDAWGTFGSAGELMKRIKQQLDPQNVLAPGRMFV
jgi:FAD/FMN-containing dehydrogenase